jgi:two-component system, OmpR family, response regulator RegX3
VTFVRTRPDLVTREQVRAYDPAGMSGPATVLVAEDDDQNRLLLRQALEREGFAVQEAIDGPAAMRLLTVDPPDVLLLDLGLPGLDGLEIITRVRRTSGLPIIVLSGRTAEEDRIAGLVAGADDYVVKPYSLAELMARVRAVQRRGAPINRPEVIEHGPLSVDLASATVRCRGELVDLTPKEFALLAFLASFPGRTFRREELLQHVWGSTIGWQDPATVTEHVRRVRVKLQDRSEDAADSIHTVRGLGYRFEAPVSA